MVTVRVGNENYSVTFERTLVGRLDKGGFENVTQTKCTILDTGLRAVAMGYAHGSPLDEDNPIKGVRIAFGRAVKRFVSQFERASKVLVTKTALNDIQQKFYKTFLATMRADRENERVARAQQKAFEDFFANLQNQADLSVLGGAVAQPQSGNFQAGLLQEASGAGQYDSLAGCSGIRD